MALEGMSMEVYGRIYDIVSGNLEQAQASFGYRKSTFLSDVGMPSQEIDVGRFLALENDCFYEAVHVAVFKRLPDERTAQFWREREALPRERFQQEALRSIANSTVAAINHICLVNNPYFVQKKGLKYHLLGCLYGLTDKSDLRRFGKKLPGPIQQVIRKVFL